MGNLVGANPEALRIWEEEGLVAVRMPTNHVGRLTFPPVNLGDNSNEFAESYSASRPYELVTYRRPHARLPSIP